MAFVCAAGNEDVVDLVVGADQARLADTKNAPVYSFQLMCFCRTAGCLSFHPMAQGVVYALKGPACRACATGASLSASPPTLPPACSA
jgi:hypothetical protein